MSYHSRVVKRAEELTFDFIVIGGGAIGTATTYELSKISANVALIDQFDLNTAASGRNAGSLHGQIQFEPFEQEGIEWARNFGHGLKILMDSLKLWDTLEAELNCDLEVSKNGGLMVAETSENMHQLEAKVKLENSLGIPSRLIEGDELFEMAPYISTKMLGAAFSPIEGKASPLLTGPSFAMRAKERGAKVFTNTEVLSITKENQIYKVHTNSRTFVAPKIIITANANIPKLFESFNLDVPISDAPVQVSVSEQVKHFIDYLIYFTTEKLTLKQAKSGSLLIGGGWPARYDFEGQPVMNPDSLRANLRVAMKVVPSIANINIIRTWVGVGNGTPDHNPIIDEVPGYPGCYVGMYPYMGFTASPLMGKLISELAVTGKCERDIKPFSLTRF